MENMTWWSILFLFKNVIFRYHLLLIICINTGGVAPSHLAKRTGSRFFPSSQPCNFFYWDLCSLQNLMNCTTFLKMRYTAQDWETWHISGSSCPFVLFEVRWSFAGLSRLLVPAFSKEKVINLPFFFIQFPFVKSKLALKNFANLKSIIIVFCFVYAHAAAVNVKYSLWTRDKDFLFQLAMRDRKISC